MSLPTPLRYRLLRTGAMIISAALFVAPLIWAVVFSLRRPGLPPPRGLEWFPSDPVWSNYAQIFAIVPLGSYLANSLFVSGLAVPLTLLVASWAGFAMAQISERARRRLIQVALAIMLAPGFALWLTRFLLYRSLHLYDTLWALIAPALLGTTPFFTLLFYWTYRRISSEVFESARLDGAGALTIWARIGLPLARPTVVAVAVLAFTAHWNDYAGPLLYLQSERNYTLPLGLQLLQQMNRTDWPLLVAAALLMTAPVIGLFLLVQRFMWAEARMPGQR
jgi:multiple sugar transport system permease protein